MTAAEFIPEGAVLLEELREAAAGCQGCELYARATSTVFGAGPEGARLVLVGEQPGDKEDLEGAPFVGPAGRLLDRALAQAGLDRSRAYVTNAVKHFSWQPSGSRRLHKKPTRAHVVACRPWLSAEISMIKPDVVCCLGATAAESVFGSPVKVGDLRGKLTQNAGLAECPVLVTVHPSSVLREPPEERELALAALVADLSVLTEEFPALRVK